MLRVGTDAPRFDPARQFVVRHITPAAVLSGDAPDDRRARDRYCNDLDSPSTCAIRCAAPAPELMAWFTPELGMKSPASCNLDGECVCNDR
jgi:hypothetical protein